MNPEKHVEEPVFQDPDPMSESLGEFAETIIDKDGELDPELLEEPMEEEIDKDE